MRPAPLAAALRAALACALLALAACDDEPRETRPRGSSSDTAATDGAATDTAASDTTPRLTSDLPPGRFELPTQVTPAPNLWITLPDGYRVKGSSRLPDDLFYIVHTEDPSFDDTSAVTPGFMRLYVGPRPQKPFEGETTTPGERVLVAGYPLQWRHAEEKLEDGRTFLKRDLATADFFARFSPELAETPLHLHVYVAGVDAERVAALMKSAESISIVP
jgi:hypothetical protein